MTDGVTGVGAMPIIDVADVEQAHDFYREKLGFKNGHIWRFDDGTASFAIVAMDKTPVGLRRKTEERDSRNEEWAAYLYVDDARAHFAAVEAAGAEIKWPLDRTFYDCLEFTVADPDGNLLAFGQELCDFPDTGHDSSEDTPT